uniref:Peptidase C14 caspase domain-containing protein n=1 Tax=Oryza nivara TaxID=4536 RepID=A0A0E0IXX7_ORYNI
MAEPPATKVYHDGCPGCAMEQRKEEHKGIPYKEFLFVAITTLASSLPISSLFPFLYFMILNAFPSLQQIRELHIARTEEDIGFYAGFLADRIGRKPVIIFSIFAVIVLNTLFGLSVKYWMAVTTRFLLGALNGLLAPIKAYSIEVCRAEHQALGLSIVSTAWGIGLVVGPAIGGYLAQETLHKHKGLETGVEAAEASTTQGGAESHKKSLFRNWPLMSSIITYCVFSLHDTAYSEIFSLWTVSDRKYGGLSFSSKDVGQVLAVAGASLLVYQLFIYRWVDKILGPINSTRIASVLSIPIIAAYPFMTHLSGIRLGVALYSAAMIKSVLAITIITGTSLLQNKAVPQGQRGAANGIATTAMSLFKAVAPAGAGDQMVFLLLNLTEVIGLMLTFKPFLASMSEEAPPSPVMRPVFYDGCPGCAMERKLESSQGIPYKEFFFVGITTIASSLPISSLFPFLYFMIEDLHVAKKEQDIGLYAGFLDRIGRKPIIKFSILSVVIFNTLFGLSVKYWMAIATRFLLGALNGMLAPIKAYSIEVCRPEHQALGLSIVSTGWGIGLVVGPAIGGYFAQPAKQYPNVFSEKSIFGRFPYFLPCLCISLIALVVLISCIWLPSQSQRGAANSISMTAMSFFKAIAPAGAGVLFSWAQERQNEAFFPGDQMIFFILNRGQKKKLATLVGCNYAGTPNELQGCINDVAAMRDALVARFGFAPADVTVLTDDRGSPVLPTGANIKRALADMVARAAPGDVLFFHYSGHGTLVPPVKGRRHGHGECDEAIVPCDFNLITDVDFRRLVDRVPRGASFTMVSDSCHSGGLIDLEKEQIGPSVLAAGAAPAAAAASTTATRATAARFLPYAAVVEHLSGVSGVDAAHHVADHLLALFGADASAKFHRDAEQPARTDDDGILLSGCQTDETSADVPGDDEVAAGGKACGAFSNAIQTVLASHPAPVSNRQLVSMARAVLSDQGFEQHPCLYCSDGNAETPFLWQEEDKKKTVTAAAEQAMFSWAQKRQHAFFFPGDQMVFFILIIIEFLELIWTFKPFLAVP